jgi:hypothetical protein
MSPTEIALLILGVVIVLAIAAYVIQGIENQRRAKRLLLMQLKDNVRRAEHLLDNIPPELYIPELQKLLTAYLKRRWATILELDNSSANQERAAETQAKTEQVVEPTPHPAGSMTLYKERDKARRARAILREQGQFVKELAAKKELAPNVAKHILTQVKVGYARASYDLEIMEAIDLETASGPVVAIHQFRNSFRNLEKLNKHQSLDRQLYEIRTHMAEMEAKIKFEEEKAEAEKKAAREEEEKNRRRHR